MNALRTGMVAVVLGVLVPAAVLGQALQPESLARRQETQKRVRVLAREMIAGILDVQLRQLEENELQATELYRDVRTMREHIDALVEAEMPRLVKLLGEIRVAAEDQRGSKYVAAREQSRKILVEFLAQRQVLLRRLRMAEMAAQVRQLIQAQTKVLGNTQALPERPVAQREPLILAGVEDQRDVKAMYLRFKETLKDVATWGGPAGTEAAGGLRLLETAKVDPELDSAGRFLGQARFPEAAASQRAILKALEALLTIIERAQGLLQGDRDSIERAIRDLAERQKEIRQSTAQPDLTQRDTEQLSQQQGDLAKQLAELSKSTQDVPEAAKPLDEAEQAAQAATEKLFDAKPAEALPQQDRVVENLQRAADQLQRAPAPDRQAPSADRLAQRIKDLEAAKKDVERIQKEQDQASAAAKTNPADAQRQENQIAQELGKVPENRDLPRQVNSRLAEAQDAATDAAGQMGQPEPQRREATRQTEQAIQRAASEIDAALANAKRQQLGGQLDRLAQALNDLEQAAATERQVAQDAKQAGQKEGLQAKQAQDLGQKQAGVQKTVGEVGKTLQQAAPEAAKALDQAAGPVQQAAEKLEAAEQQPGEASKPAAAEAGKQAQQAAEKIAEAAQKLRDQMARNARLLADLAAQQLQQVEQAEQAVDKAIADRPESFGERLDRLARAAEEVQKAAVDQQRAAGRPEAARAMDLIAGIEKAIAMQNRADRAADALANRPSATPLEAANRQQEVAQAAGQLRKQASGEDTGQEKPADSGKEKPKDAGTEKPKDTGKEKPKDAGTEKPKDAGAEKPKDAGDEKGKDPPAPPNPLAQTLAQAEKAAGEAAKDLLDSKPAEAKQSRAETRQALEEALKLAKQTAKQAEQAPAGLADPKLQERVGQEIAAAQDLAQPDAPQAAQTLGEAGKTSAEAQKEASGGKPEAAAAPQKATSGSLDQAAKQIAAAMQQLAQQAAQQMAAQAQAADRLADQTAPVDPGATSALHAAENVAQQAAGMIPQSPQLAKPAGQAVGAAMEQAAAELGARHQELAQAAAMAQQAAAMASHPSDQASPIIAQGGMARSGQKVVNQPPTPAPVQPTSRVVQGDSRTGEAANPDPSARRKLADEAWIMQLPPELRSAIRANANRRPPRAYEERLERYFKNID